MKNYIHPGKTVHPNAPYAVASGAGLLVGALFGVAAFAAAQGERVEMDTCGVFDLPKADAQAWTVGQKVYWDDTAKVCTTVSNANTLIGCALVPVASTAGLVVGRVRLNGVVA